RRRHGPHLVAALLRSPQAPEARPGGNVFNEIVVMAPKTNMVTVHHLGNEAINALIWEIAITPASPFLPLAAFVPYIALVTSTTIESRAIKPSQLVYKTTVGVELNKDIDKDRPQVNTFQTTFNVADDPRARATDPPVIEDARIDFIGAETSLQPVVVLTGRRF